MYPNYPGERNIEINEIDDKPFYNDDSEKSKATFFSEYFNGTFPNGWTVGDFNSLNGADYWDDLTCRSHCGDWSCWCADIGDMTNCDHYDYYMNAYMQPSTPFNFTGYSSSVQLSWWIWYDTEPNYDYFRRYWSSDGGTTWSLATAHEFDGNSGGWIRCTQTISNSFTNYLFRFVFYSDGIISSYEGVYVDDIELNTTLEDNYEPNDSRTDICMGPFYERTWLNTVDGYGRQGDYDWYEINVTSNFNRILIDCQFTHADGDIDIALYDAAGTYIGSSSSITDDEYIDACVADQGGTHYIRVSYGNAGNTYNLWWDDVSTPSCCTDDTYEDNDTYTTAAYIYELTWISAVQEDYDYYERRQY
jgi:hypothetical protein